MKAKTIKRLLDLHTLSGMIRLHKNSTPSMLENGIINPQYERLDNIQRKTYSRIRDTLAGQLALAESREEK